MKLFVLLILLPLASFSAVSVKVFDSAGNHLSYGEFETDSKANAWISAKNFPEDATILRGVARSKDELSAKASAIERLKAFDCTNLTGFQKDVCEAFK